MSFKPKKSPKGKPEPETRAIEGEILPPESPSEKASSQSSGTTSSGEHLDGLADEIPEPGPSTDTDASGGEDVGTDAPGDGSSREPPVPAGALPFEAWYEEVFVNAHTVGGDLMELRAPGLWVKRPLAPLAAKAFYRTCCRSPFLHFMLKPGPGWIGDAVLIGMYTVPLALAIRAEVGFKMAQAQAAQGTATDAAGGESSTAESDDPMTRAAGVQET